MGPNFNAGATRLGRDRLPPGIVAILDQPETLRLAFGEMYDFVADGNLLSSGRAGVIFRTVSDGERDALNVSVQKVCGDVNAACGNTAGFRHLLDVNHIRHICNSHGNAEAERARGQIAVAKEDFYRIPEVVLPYNLVQCILAADSPRLVYSRECEGASLVVVEEIRRARKELVVITLYKCQ